MKQKLLYNQAKFDYMVAYWEDQLVKYKLDLVNSSKANDKEELKLFEKDLHALEPLRDKLIKCYLDKCKLKHLFAFL
jgi:hypothetical protein